MRMTRYQRLVSPDGSIVVVVVRPPDCDGVLECDGQPMVHARPVPCSVVVVGERGGSVEHHDSRFRDRGSGLEICCVRGRFRELTYSGHRLVHSSG